MYQVANPDFTKSRPPRCFLRWKLACKIGWLAQFVPITEAILNARAWPRCRVAKCKSDACALDWFPLPSYDRLVSDVIIIIIYWDGKQSTCAHVARMHFPVRELYTSGTYSNTVDCARGSTPRIVSRVRMLPFRTERRAARVLTAGAACVRLLILIRGNRRNKVWLWVYEKYSIRSYIRYFYTTHFILILTWANKQCMKSGGWKVTCTCACSVEKLHALAKIHMHSCMRAPG